MATIKVLHRRHAPSSLPVAAPSLGPISALMGSLGSFFRDTGTQMARARKTADGEPFGIVDRVREFINMNAPGITLDDAASGLTLAQLLSKVKGPATAVLGAAALATIAFLVYKLYTNRASIAETVDRFMADLRSTAPDLIKVPGWLDSMRRSVATALKSDSPAAAVSALADMKGDVIERQESIAPDRVGSGIDVFRDEVDLRGPPGGYGGGVSTSL